MIPVRGPDAHDLLQRVLTLDVDEAVARGIGYGALLSPQGKILFDFLLHRAPDGFAFDISAPMAADFVKRLSLYRLRARAEIGPVEPGLAVFVAWDDAPGDRDARGRGDAPAEGSVPPKGDPPRDAPFDPRLAGLGRRWLATPDSVATNADVAAFHAHRISHTIPEGGIDFVFGDAFPHDAALDSLHGIAFRKGCYIGQEVVSRMQHRGTARRRIVAVTAAGPLPGAGAEIVAGERPLGRLGSSVGGRGIGLVRLDRLREALDLGVAVRAGPEEIHAALPAWATYDWPREPASSEG